MIFRDALRSLRRDFSRAIFYWLTFVIVTTFFFLFFNFSSAEASGFDFIDQNYLITGVIVLMLVVCSIDIFFANNFFIKTKAKDIGIRLVCGATYVQIASFLLIQTLVLLATAVPAAGLITAGLIPVCNAVLRAMTDSVLQIRISSDSLMLTGIVIGYLLFWLILLNLSFAYKNTAGTMMNERNLTRNRGNGSVLAIKGNAIVKKVFFSILFLAPLAGFWFVPSTVYIVLAFIGIYGFSGFIKNVVQPFCSRISSESGLENPDQMILAGFFSTDLMVNSLNIMLYIISVISLVAMLILAQGKAMETGMILAAYVTACLLQSMVLMFRASSEFATRRKYYHTLAQIGFIEDDMHIITFKETLLFFGFVLVCAMAYIFTIFANMVKLQIISGGTSFILSMILVIPMLVFCFFTWRYYHKCTYPITTER